MAVAQVVKTSWPTQRVHATLGQFMSLEGLMAVPVRLKQVRLDLAVVRPLNAYLPMPPMRFKQLFPGIELRLSIDHREIVLGACWPKCDLAMLGRTSAHLDCVATAFSINPWAIVTAPGHALVRRQMFAV